MIQDCQSIRLAWEKFCGRYASKSITTEMIFWNTLLSTKLCKGADKEDHVSRREACFRRFASIGCSLSESMKIALSLSSFSNLPEYLPIITSVNTMQREIASEIMSP